VPGAQVRWTIADGQGAFALDALPAGPFALHAKAEGFLRTDQVVDVRPGAEPVVVALARGAVVRVVARHDLGRAANAQRLAAVRLGPDGKPDEALGIRRQGTGDGRFAWRLPPGRWRVYASRSSDDFASEPPLADWDLAEGETRDAQLTLPGR
jgi:hypothetical protein